MAFKDEFQEPNLPFHDSSVTKSRDPKFFEILICQEEETVAFNVVFPEILNTITEPDLAEPIAHFSDGPLID